MEYNRSTTDAPPQEIFDRKIKIGVISINRKENMAYIWMAKDNPYWSTNLEVNLSKLESLLSVEFSKNYGLIWVSAQISQQDWDELYGI